MRLLLTITALHLIVVAHVLAVPALTDDEQRQLQVARDGTNRIDGDPALYPLLRSAMTWQPGDEAGAAVPDFDAIINDPAAHRGGFYLIEGVLARAAPFRAADQEGPWAANLQRWDIMIGQRPDERVITVLLVSPPVEARVRHAVRLPARFFKVYEDRDINNTPRNYPVFVGQSATLVGTIAPENNSNWAIAIALIAMVALAFFLLRRWVSATRRLPPLATRIIHERIEARRRDEGDDEADDDAPPLPDDPVDALDELSRRRASDADTGLTR